VCGKENSIKAAIRQNKDVQPGCLYIKAVYGNVGKTIPSELVFTRVLVCSQENSIRAGIVQSKNVGTFSRTIPLEALFTKEYIYLQPGDFHQSRYGILQSK